MTTPRATLATALGPLGSLLFSLIFLLMGGGLFYFMAVHPYLQGVAARDWMETPCMVVHSQVKSHRGSKNNTTYSPDIHYTYQVNGREYRSERYQFLGGSSSGRASKAAAVARYPRGQTAICYVNPNDPQEAVLDRTPFPGGLWTFFPLIFVAAGAGILIAGIRGRSREAVLSELFAAGEPWKIRPDWAEERTVASTRGELYKAWSGTVLWNGFSGIIAVIVLSQNPSREELPPVWLVIPFALVGVGLLWRALRTTRYWLRFGESVLEMHPFPAAPGAALKGAVQLNCFIRTDDPVQIWLQCMQRVTVRRGKNRSTSENLLWEQAETVEMAPTGNAIPVAFTLPDNALTTTAWLVGVDGIFWRITIQAKLPGWSYKANFEIPVAARVMEAIQGR